MRRKWRKFWHHLRCALVWLTGWLPRRLLGDRYYFRPLLCNPPIKLSQGRYRLFIGFKPWKQDYIPHYFPQEHCLFLRDHRWPGWCLKPFLRHFAGMPVTVWSFKERPSLTLLLTHLHMPVTRMEDGFIRSVGLGARHTLPYSQVIDPVGMYFDARRPSALEQILNESEFTSEECEEARRCIDRLLQEKLSKYNATPTHHTIAASDCRTILVLGQVEDDASILYGYGGPLRNNDLVRLAVSEQPDARILYKPHPDVLAGLRPALSRPEEVADIAEILPAAISLDAALAVADHIYTLTSLAGFEALWRGKRVTCLGMPFYAGWGLTDDRMACPRRRRTRRLEEVFAAAYLRYALYRDPQSGASLSLPEVMQRIAAEQQAQKTLD